MSDVTVSADGFVIDAALVGAAFGIDPEAVPGEMRSGDITSRSETGAGDDAGRFRLTLFRQGRALRLTVDEAGTILTRATFPVSKLATFPPLTPKE